MPVIKTKVERLKPGSQYIATVRLKNTDLSVSSEYSDTIRFIVPSDTTIPGKLQNLKIYANFMTVMFVFDPSNEKDALEYEYELYNFDEVVEIGSTLIVAEGKTPSFTGRSRSNVFTVSLNQDFSTDRPNSYTNEVGLDIEIYWYGRVRTIDTSGNIGPWSDIARSDDTPLIEDQFVKNLTASKITAGTIGAHTITLAGTNSIIQSSNYISGSQGWQIKGDGSAEFDSTVIRGGLRAGSIFIDSNNRWNTDSSGATGTGFFKVGSAAKYVEWNPTNSTLNIAGNLVGATGTFSGSLSAATGTFSGSLSAATGTFSGSLSAATGTFSGSLDAASGTFSGSLSAATGSFSGSITSTSGTIGGWSIGLSSISAGSTVLNSNGTIVCNILQTRSSITGSIRMGINVGNGEELEFYRSNSSTAKNTLRTVAGLDTFRISTVSGRVYDFEPNYFKTNSGLQIGVDNSGLDLNPGSHFRSKTIFDTTVSTGSSNLFIATSPHAIFRITSSLRYKTDIENIEDSYAKRVLDLRPVWYRSLCDGDKGLTTYGFIAEEVAEVEPRLVNWVNERVVGHYTDDYGNEVEIKEQGFFPEGVHYDRIIPHIVYLLKDVYKKIENLELKIIV
jgi:hypothetical protein